MVEDKDTIPTSMLDFVLNSGVSNDGEMFCAYNLARMCEEFHRLRLQVSSSLNLSFCASVITAHTDISENLLKIRFNNVVYSLSKYVV